MKTIRHQMFETNSSSSHSVSITETQNLLGTIDLDDNGDINFNDERFIKEFGWDIEEYTDAPTKAAYLVVALNNRSDDRLINMFVNVLKYQTGANNVIIHEQMRPPDQTYSDWHIDHQSYDVADEVLTDEESIRHFIFNADNILKIDNDNH